MFYVNTENDEVRILNASEVRKEVSKKLDPIGKGGVILPEVINDSVLNHFGYKRVLIVDNQDNLVKDKEGKPVLIYYNTRYSKPAININGEWECRIIYEIDSNKLNHLYEHKRKERDDLLKEAISIIHNETITDETKTKYKHYITLLRMCLNKVAYPHCIVFPNKPDVIYKDEFLLLLNQDRKLTNEEIEKIRTHIPNTNTDTDNKDNNNLANWRNFLIDWKRHEFTKNYNYVITLIRMYMQDNYETIIGI